MDPRAPKTLPSKETPSGVLGTSCVQPGSARVRRRELVDRGNGSNHDKESASLHSMATTPASSPGALKPLYPSFRVPRQKRQRKSPTKAKSGPWDPEEQRAFLHGIVCFGWGRWKEIGTLVASRYEAMTERATFLTFFSMDRTNSQIKSYGQKLAAKQKGGEDIFAMLKEPSPVPKQLPEEVSDLLEAAQSLFAFGSAPPSAAGLGTGESMETKKNGENAGRED